MAYRDLRDWLTQVEELGELKRIQGAHWNLEMGAICDIMFREAPKPVPAILFDDIPDYPSGYRALFGQIGSMKRTALTLGMPLDYSPMGFVKAMGERIKNIKPIPPQVVGEGPVMENIRYGDDIDLLEFPAPFHHELDGGRYLGTACVCITRDPDEGWVNVGTYRAMVHDKNTLGIHINPGKHGRIHRDKYFERGKPLPIAIAMGVDPLLWLASSLEVPWEMCEYDYAGGLRGEPMKVMTGEVIGLPIPSNAEIVIEGECPPGETVLEGPFGEWAGYYANRGKLPVPEPIVRVKKVMYRTNPILTCSNPSRPPHEHSFHRSAIRSALIWDELEKLGVPDVRGVWCHEAGGSRLLNVVSVKQRYPGHAKQAGVLAAQCHSGAYVGRYVIVVDEDIDPSNIYDVLWALATRSDPERSIDIIRRCWSSSADPAFHPDQKGFNSRAIIEACRPYEWMGDLMPVAETSPQLRQKILDKFGRSIIE
ncbi:MAG: UbiD family decarboxylase [Chloroflexi bacterium]|nr:UbiD family decarboxylase [Chloroflexota bacterium]